VAFGSGRSVPGKSRTMVLLTPNKLLHRSAGGVFRNLFGAQMLLPYADLRLIPNQKGLAMLLLEMQRSNPGIQSTCRQEQREAADV
jgi:hypothetical protein